MNRKERRAAAETRTAEDPALLTLAETHMRRGLLDEADALAKRVLEAAPNHARALFLRGVVARRQGRPEAALAHLAGAAHAAPDVAAIHDALAEAARATGQHAQAERHYRRVAELHPGAATLLNLGNALMQLERHTEAAEAYKSALRFDARVAEAYYGLGTALAALGIPEAGDAFARAASLRPDFILAHEGLIDACSRAGAWGAALQASCAALLRVDSPGLRVQFVDCVVNVALVAEVPGLRAAMQRALTERWTRPGDLARAVCDIVMLRQPLDADDALLGVLLDLAPVCHPDIERALAARRRSVLETACAGRELAPPTLAAAYRLGLQCFINEYAWAFTPSESASIDVLRQALQSDLDCGAAASATKLAALALYLPLSCLAGAERLLAQGNGGALGPLLTQQISEPAEEARLRGALARATAIEDEVSQRVRDQYEANPYPRWVTMGRQAAPVRLGDWLIGRFAEAPMVRLPTDRPLDVLIAGCGTGQQALETARGFADMRVLAIDLSLASLAYAARMTKALDVDAIIYAQADLLGAARLGRSFDMIAAGGVLHHMADPWAGWRSLLGCLRPGGVMNVLLYTERGRSDVRAAREWIAAQGFPATPDGIRACRQALMQRPDEWAGRLAESPDFNSISGCRDLLFHVQEQAVTLPALADFIAAESLTLLGVEASPSTEQAFEACNGGSTAASRDLARWDLFESEHPRCFARMINLWVQLSVPLGPRPS